jgi:hypothetical protein
VGGFELRLAVRVLLTMGRIGRVVVGDVEQAVEVRALELAVPLEREQRSRTCDRAVGRLQRVDRPIQDVGQYSAPCA